MDSELIPKYDPGDDLLLIFSETEEGVKRAVQLWNEADLGGEPRWPHGVPYCLTHDLPTWPLADRSGWEEWEVNLLGPPVCIRMTGVTKGTLKDILERFPSIESVEVSRRK